MNNVQGFLRVMESSEPLDNTSVHPESYEVARNLIKQLGYREDDLKNKKLMDIEDRVKETGINKLVESLDVGEPTLLDIIKELKKPGRDPRKKCQSLY